MERILEYVFNNWLLGITLITFILGAIFVISWLHEPRRLINGIFFQIFFVVFLFWLASLILATNNQALIYTTGTIFLIGLVGIILLLSFSWLFLLFNSYFVWKRESHSLPNLLTLILGLFLVVVWIFSFFQPKIVLPDWVNVILSAVPVVTAYLEFTLMNFLINLSLYQFVPKRYNQDYLVVLGAGLIDGMIVSKLLGARIDAALTFNQKQQQKTSHRAKIIMSGGQGRDEKIPESVAMARYAEEKLPEQNVILLEDQSKNTLQNMAFSKKIADADFGSDSYHALFVTNNYHTFRAGLDAKKAGLNANGLGAKTRLYFLPNAILREFAAVFMMHKVRHFLTISALSILAIALSILVTLGS